MAKVQFQLDPHGLQEERDKKHLGHDLVIAQEPQYMRKTEMMCIANFDRSLLYPTCSFSQTENLHRDFPNMGILQHHYSQRFLLSL